MSNEKTRYQLLLERLSSDPELKERALNATPEEFLALCKEKGLKIEADKAGTLQKQLKAAFDSVSGELSSEQMETVAGGIDCSWGCGKLQCC